MRVGLQNNEQVLSKFDAEALKIFREKTHRADYLCKICTNARIRNLWNEINIEKHN